MTTPIEAREAYGRAPRRRAIAPMAHRELRPEHMHFGTIIGSLDYPELAVLVLGRDVMVFHPAEVWKCLVLRDDGEGWKAGAVVTFKGTEPNLILLDDVGP